MKAKHLHRIIIALSVFICYGNTISLKYALDDRVVILESQYTIQGGFQSLKSILTEDTFSGYFGGDKNLVAGGRYRPLSQVSFMIEGQLFGKDVKQQIGDVSTYERLHNPKNEEIFESSILPYISHCFNILYFLLLCLLIYEILSRIFPADDAKKNWLSSLAFLATLIFAIHPIHTEVVANLKGRDEIFAMLGAMGALFCSLKYTEQHKCGWLILSLISFVFGIFSKENAITFLAIVPLTIYFANGSSARKKDYLLTLLPLVMGSILYIVVRSIVLGGFMPSDESQNILNNPFVHSSKVQEIATVIITWGIYLKLLFIPHPLTHDYYPNQIAITDFSNPLVWIFLLGIIVLVYYAVKHLKQRSVPAYAILFFIITFSITSNLLFNVGTFMNERFLFMSSLGFTIILGYWLHLLLTSGKSYLHRISIILLCVVGGLFMLKTITRNLVWKDDITLFLTDVKTSDKSIKCNISAGGSYLKLWKQSHHEKDKKNAYKHLEKAIRLNNLSLNAYMLLGELMYLDGNIDGSYEAYRMAAYIDPRDKLAQENLEKVSYKKDDLTLNPISQLLDQGILEKNPHKIEEANQKIDAFLKNNPESILGLNIKGNIMGRGYGRLDEAIHIYEQILQKDPTYSSAWENMGIAYAIKRNFNKAEECLLNALKYAPDNDNVKKNLYFMYMDMGERQKAEKIRSTISEQ